MKFEEILPLLRQGKKVHSSTFGRNLYLVIKDEWITWFDKNDETIWETFSGGSSILNNDWEIYEKETKDNKKERKLVDFCVNWYPTVESINRNERDLLDEGWETFKKESLDHNTGLMTHKLMMVKYE